MSLKDDKQQNIRKQPDFSDVLTGEAREAGGEDTESSAATSEPESPARTDRLMEEVLSPYRKCLGSDRTSSPQPCVPRHFRSRLATIRPGAMRMSFSGPSVNRT